MRPTRKITAPEKGPEKGNEIATVRIELSYTEPLIWRQVEVPTSMTFLDLHHVIQIAMGWLDYHLWEFTIDKQSYGLSMDEDWGTAPRQEAAKVRLRDVLKPRKTKIDYLYDFGDDWHHRLVVTDIRPASPGVAYPNYVGGEHNAPPEDCGGIPGFYDKLRILADPEDPDYDEVKEWMADYDAESFDDNAIKAELVAMATH